jgi:lipopolysaccharide export system permease protein
LEIQYGADAGTAPVIFADAIAKSNTSGTFATDFITKHRFRLMKKIDWYIIRKFLGTFFYAIAMLAVIIIIFDLSEKIDDFIEKDAPLRAIIFDYYLNFIPYLVNMFSALFTFIAVIFFTSRMATNTEIIAILSSGISFWRMMRPYLVSAALLGLLSFTLASYIIPVTNRTLFAFERTYIKNPKRNQSTNIHIQISPGVFVYVERFNNFTDEGHKFSVEKIDSSGLYYKLSADQIKWDSINQSWSIINYQIRRIDSIGERLVNGQQIDTVLNMVPDDFIMDVDRIRLLTTPELNKFIAIEKMKGSAAVIAYQVEKHSRIAFPFANIILAIIGVSVSSRKIRGGTGLHLGIGLTLTFSYVLFMQISTVYGVYGGLPPFVATWIPNLLFGILALFLIRNAPK